MKRIVAMSFVIVMFLTACASPAANTPTPAEQVQSAPTQEVIPVANTATPTFIPEPTSSPTSLPPSLHWYWDVDSETEQVVAVNQLGEVRELGTVDRMDNSHTLSIPIGNERALLFLDNDDALRVYLLTPDGMQKVALPSDPFYFDAETSHDSLAVIADHESTIVFSYVIQDSGFDMPAAGPLFLLDLNSLTARLVDERVNREKETYRDIRFWIHTSQDGRYLRYLNGSKDNMDIRELDMVTGDVRTIYTTSGSSYNIRTSPQGDLWYLRGEGIILDDDGNQTDFTDDSLAVRPLTDGRALVFPRDCADMCEIRVISPFNGDSELTYTLPWGIVSATYFTGVTRLLPDQSLLFVGDGYAFLTGTPAIVESYPGLTEEDSPVFRLTPEGQASVMGVYMDNFSTDALYKQYILMRSIDQTSFYVYDTVTDTTLFDIPIESGLMDFQTNIKFFEDGILVDWSSSTLTPESDHAYRFFYSGYIYQTAAAMTWEDVQGEVSSRIDLLEDGSMVYWQYPVNSDYFDLISYNLSTGTRTALLKNAWLINYIP